METSMNENIHEEEDESNTPDFEKKSKFKTIMKLIGPGVITGASDDDPSGIGTYTNAGASLGNGILWTALLTFPLMTVVQYLSAKIGIVSGQGLAAVLKKHYAGWILYPSVFALLIANTINLGADLGAIAAAINLFLPVPIPVLIIPVTLLILVVQIWGSYRIIVNVLRWTTFALFSYVATVFFAKPDWLDVLQGTFVPRISLDANFIATLVAILGTTISPYLFFWQSDQEVEEKKAQGKKTLTQRQGATKKELRFASWDIIVGMLLSNLVMYAIIVATAATLFRSGQHDVQSAADAAQALRPLAGDFASILLAIGLIGSGGIAIPILSGSSAYAIAEAFGWQNGLDQRPQKAKRFYIIIGTATLIGMCINFIGINPIDALYWTAVINGVLAPPILVLLMLIGNNRHVMGTQVIGLGMNIIGWLTAILMAATAVTLLVLLILGAL